MALIRKVNGKSGNPLLEGASGSIGSLVIKQTKHGIQITKRRSTMPRRRKKGQAELEKISLFQQAVRYAKLVIADPKRKAAYHKKRKGKRNAYQAALSDYLTNPMLNMKGQR